MYQHKITSFGEFQKHTFENPITKNSFSVVPDAGACVLDIVFQEKSILDAYQTPTELRFNKWAKNCILYPFPNRLKDGKYEWEGKIYQFPINDSHTGNALHGFGMAKKMSVKKVAITDSSAQIICSYSYSGEYNYYPFPFTVDVEFGINDEQKFIVNISIQNDGTTTMPIGWGWHPYFQLSEKIEEVSLQFPACEWIGLDGKMIPTGKCYFYNEFEQPKRIGSAVLDNCFAILGEQHGKRFEVNLKTTEHRLTYWQNTGKNNYNFIQLFTPAYRRSIAIEPMICNIDALNNQEGLLILQPEERITASFGVDYERISV